jgi:hypothetical protein
MEAWLHAGLDQQMNDSPASPPAVLDLTWRDELALPMRETYQMAPTADRLQRILPREQIAPPPWAAAGPGRKRLPAHSPWAATAIRRPGRRSKWAAGKR